MAEQSSSNVRPIGVSEAVASLAAELNEDVARIRVRDETWTKYIQEGILVDLHVRRWRGRAQIELEHLGIRPASDEERKALERVLALGSRYLLPRDIMKRAESIESEARYWLEKCSFKTFWGRWVHKGRYAEWKQRNDEIGRKYAALADEIDERWDELLEAVTRDHAIVGLQTYQRLVRAGAVLPPPEQWVPQVYVAQVLTQIWDRARVRASFSFDYDAELVPLAQQVAADQARARRIRLDAAEQEMLDDVRRTEARRAAEGVSRFVADIKAQISEQVYGAAVDCLDALRKGDGRLGRNNTRQLKALAETVSKAVFWEDENLEARMAELNRIVAIDSDKRSESELTEALQALGAEARIVLTELDRVGERRARPDLGLSDDLGDLARVARRSRDELVALDELALPEAPSGRLGRGGRRRELDLAI